MVAFRRVITALAVLALFTGLASAQVGGTGQTQLTCSTNVSVTPQLRGEGYTEQTGDITISCSGGSPITAGNSIPLVNITVFYNATVTSRLLASWHDQRPLAKPSCSSMSRVPVFRVTARRCRRCSARPRSRVARRLSARSRDPPLTQPLFPEPHTPAPNVYEGVCTCHILFKPRRDVLRRSRVAPDHDRFARLPYHQRSRRRYAADWRFASGASPVQANIAISGATSLSISNSAPIVGYVSAGLTATASGATSLNQCSTQTKTSVNTLTFTENFGTAFKTRVAAQSNTLYAGQITPQNTPPYPNNNGNQAVPGAIYNSESNFVFPVTTANSSGTAGLADFGTRLKATFNNIPSGARVFVSTVEREQQRRFPITAPSPDWRQ